MLLEYYAVMRRAIGVGVLALSVLYSVADLAGWLRPMLLRMRVHQGPSRWAAIVLGSLTLKALMLMTGAVLAFWPERARPAQPQGPSERT
jgi:hypothetical protein